MTTQPILVIEDHPVNRELITSLLEVHGFLVCQADTAAGGIELARTQAPCLILMDVSLPGMNGLDATRLLKSDPLTADIPVVAITAYAFAKDRVAASAAGCCGFITKPIDTRAMITEVKRIIAEHHIT